MARGRHTWQGGGACMVGGMCEKETATEAGSTHPTGMHSCIYSFCAATPFCFPQNYLLNLTSLHKQVKPLDFHVSGRLRYKYKPYLQ